MMWQLVIFWVFAGGLAGGFAVCMLNWMVRRVRRMSAKRIAESIPDAAQILLQDTGANFFGLQSLGAMQIRGNGGLALTASGLYFCMLVPRRNLEIPLCSIEQASLVRSHCGKTVFRDLLNVTYRTVQGGTQIVESAAWSVRDAAGWQVAIERARRGG
jgi:hypothetical protein